MVEINGEGFAPGSPFGGYKQSEMVEKEVLGV